MHSVVIGIGGHYYVVVAEVVDVVLHAEGVDEEVEFFVFGYALAAFLVGIDRLAAQAEHSLVCGVAGLGDGSACGVALGDEDAAALDVFLRLLRSLVAVVVAAVAEFTVIDGGLAVALAGLLLDAGDLLPFLL